MTEFEADAKPSSQRMHVRREELRFWTEEKLRNTDTDQFKHVNNAAIATFFEAARMEIVAPPPIRALMGGANLAVVRLLIEFGSELHFPGRVRVGSTVVEVGNTSFRVRQGLFDEARDDCCAVAEAVCVLLNGETGRTHRIAPELRAHLLAHGVGEETSNE
ncbi:acyl-CoA thioesterase [Paraburkholderia ferrariae]|uniref:Acyl-CoA thioesterase n=1 Tax=Paraburkholderia ferrariae TaxID=386056 RepID=A0ABU9RV46_9BURK